MEAPERGDDVGYFIMAILGIIAAIVIFELAIVLFDDHNDNYRF